MQSRYRAPAAASSLRQILWTDEAAGNLEAIFTYISAFNPAAARRLAERLVAVADSLAEFPNRGRDAGVMRARAGAR